MKPKGPLPWKLVKKQMGEIIVMDAEGKWVDIEGDPYTIHAANAQPDLIRALSDLLKATEGLFVLTDREAFELAGQAIADAKALLKRLDA